MATQLPRYIALKSQYNSKYLYYIKQAGTVQRFLQFSGETVLSPYAKHEVDEASSGDEGLVHIRCCYNNKCWVRESETSYWIVAAADAPEEDQSKWSCTLFEPLFADDETIQLRHVQLQTYACFSTAANPLNGGLYATATPDEDKCDVFTVFDWSTLVILPEHLAFKGDNGKYLKCYWFQDHEFLQFNSDDVGEQYVPQQIFYTPGGHVRIMANYFGKYWRNSTNWIWTDTTDTTSDDPDTVFWPVKVDEKVIALRNEGNNNYCKRLSDDYKTDCLNAAVPTITNEAKLEIEEPLISRSIYDVDFRLADARIYNENILTMATAVAINETEESNIVTLKFSYTDTTTNTWNSTLSLKLGADISFESGIPFIYEGNIELSAQTTWTYQWGQTKTTTNQLEAIHTITVPAMSIVNVILLATKGTCDVPFSYTQVDVKTDGQQVTSYLDDGVYTGINSYNFYYEAQEQSLTA